MVLRAMKRGDGPFKDRSNRKDPLTLAELHTLVAPATSSGDCLWRAVYLTVFFGMMRMGEVCLTGKFDPEWDLRTQDVVFLENRVELTVRASKTDFFGAGDVVVLPRLEGHPLCPYAALERLKSIRVAEGSWTHLSPLFMVQGKSARYGAAHERLLQRLHPAGNVVGHPRLGCHSLRRGMAVLAREAGVSPDMIKAWGRWKGDSYLIYAEFSAGERESVSRRVWKTTGDSSKACGQA